jgi:hypothetical protein
MHRFKMPTPFFRSHALLCKKLLRSKQRTEAVNLLRLHSTKIRLLSSLNHTRWFKYDRDKLWLVYTQIVPVIFEPPFTSSTLLFVSIAWNSLLKPLLRLLRLFFSDWTFRRRFHFNSSILPHRRLLCQPLIHDARINIHSSGITDCYTCPTKKINSDETIINKNKQFE